MLPQTLAFVAENNSKQKSQASSAVSKKQPAPKGRKSGGGGGGRQPKVTTLALSIHPCTSIPFSPSTSIHPSTSSAISSPTSPISNDQCPEMHYLTYPYLKHLLSMSFITNTSFSHTPCSHALFIIFSRRPRQHLHLPPLLLPLPPPTVTTKP